MKKSLFFLLVLVCTSCGCMLSQVPPQTIMAGSGCTAPLPDFRTKVIATDNCSGTLVITQTPAPGTLLSVTNPAITVVMTAKDQFNNVSRPLSISVTLIDTVKPILSWPVGQANMTDQDLINVYQNWVAGVKVLGIAKWMYDRKWQNGIPLADSTVAERLKYFTNVIKLTDEEYAQYVSYMQSK